MYVDTNRSCKAIDSIYAYYQVNIFTDTRFNIVTIINIFTGIS